MAMTITGKLDQRFSEATEATSWESTAGALAAAACTGSRPCAATGDPRHAVGRGVGRRHVRVLHRVHRTEGPQPAGGTDVVVTTGTNTWNSGLDVVVEGTAARVTGRDRLKALADAYRAKYGDDWDFDCDDEVFEPQGQAAIVYRVTPAKVLAFAKSPHGQTAFRF